MKVAIIGTGYVGLVTGACFAEMGVDVTCVDVDVNKIDKLKQGIIPIYEPGLDNLVERNHKVGRLNFSTSLAETVQNVEVIFIAVGTPMSYDGSADLQYVMQVAKEIGENINNYCLVVNKSTVPVGTAIKVKQAIAQQIKERGLDVQFDVASNPEFLKEGSAIKDFMTPDRVVVGTDSEKAEEILTKLYRPFLLNNFRVVFMDITSAEITKYAANAMLATRISFMNDIANLCDKVGADINNVRKGIGTDARIGSKFLYAGCGYGGSCFPKDVRAIVKTASEYGLDLKVIQSVSDVNECQKTILYNKLVETLETQNLKGKKIAIWGLAFKPNTDDMREAPSLVVIEKLIQAGAQVQVFDPVAMDEAKKDLKQKVTYCKDIYECANDADALLLLTEWQEFRLPNWNVVQKLMNGNLIIDGRNIYNPQELKTLGFKYLGIGVR